MANDYDDQAPPCDGNTHDDDGPDEPTEEEYAELRRPFAEMAVAS